MFGLGRYDEAEDVFSAGLKFDANNQALKKGLEDVKVTKMSYSPNESSNPFASVFQGDVLSKLAGNPQTAPFLSDSDFMKKVMDLQRNPQLLNQYMSDPRMMQVIAVLLGINVEASSQPQKPEAEPQPEEPMDEVEETAVEIEQTPEEIEESQRRANAKSEKENGNQFYKKKDFENALSCYSKAWELDDTNITFLTNKAAVLFEQGDFEKCIEICQQAVERGRELRTDFKIIAKAYARLGNAYVKLDNIDEAIKFYNKSLSEHRTADILTKLKDCEKVKETRTKLAYQDPAKAEEARNQGNELFKNGKFAEAVSFYTEAIKRAETDPRGYSNRAACYAKLMAISEALKDNEKAIELDPTFVKAYIRKAAIQVTMKEFAKSIQTCEDALNVDAEHHAGKFRAEIETQKQKATMAMYGRGEGDENLSQEERAKRGMQDPKVQEIMADPVMRQILEQMSTDPAAAREHLSNPMIREKIQVLAAAGIIGLR